MCVLVCMTADRAALSNRDTRGHRARAAAGESGPDSESEQHSWIHKPTEQTLFITDPGKQGLAHQVCPAAAAPERV